jgi:hypothetical protein
MVPLTLGLLDGMTAKEQAFMTLINVIIPPSNQTMRDRDWLKASATEVV